MVVLKNKSIDEPLYEALKKLQEIVVAHDGIYLKLELDYKYHHLQSEVSTNEFLCYSHEGEDAELIGYIGILAFGDTAEISGMVHPEHRKRGVFTELFNHVKTEILSRKFKKILLLSDQRSFAGKIAIQSVGGVYENSEYEMTYTTHPLSNRFMLRFDHATQDDLPTIIRIDYACFGNSHDETFDTTYVARFDDQIVGKTRIELLKGQGGIFGLGILPEFRGRGFGKALLENSVYELKAQGAKRIYLQVLTENENALGLYKNTGFAIDNRMDYYALSI